MPIKKKHRKTKDAPPEGMLLEKETANNFSSETINIKSNINLKKPINAPNKLKASSLIVLNKETIVKAQEPWPKDVKLYQPYEVEQILLPDNANCLAVQAFLRMCNLEFQIVSKANAEFMSPTGKVPFIKCGAFVVSEMDAIVQFVNNKGITLTSQMETDQKADMRAYISLLHNCLENAELYLCWVDPETYNQVTKPRNGSVYPWPLNHIQTISKRNKVCKRLKVMGWYGKTLEDVFQEIENCCQALTDRLDNNEYFYGKSYTELDALVYGHVYALLNMSLPTSNNKLYYLIRKYHSLLDHCQKLHFRIMEPKLVNNSSNFTAELETTIGDFIFHDDSLTAPNSELSKMKFAVNINEMLLK